MHAYNRITFGAGAVSSET